MRNISQLKIPIDHEFYKDVLLKFINKGFSNFSINDYHYALNIDQSSIIYRQGDNPALVYIDSLTCPCYRGNLLC